MAKARAADAADVLLDELFIEIFARLPDVLDLIRCAGTCTRCFRLICCPESLRRIGLLTENARHRSFLIGAFCHGGAVLVSASEPMSRICESPPLFFGLRTQPAGSASPTVTSFIPNNDGTFNYAHPLVSRRGLLLVRTMPTPLDRGELHLAVCHPLIGEASTRLVPPPPLRVNTRDVRGDVTGYALLTAADHRVCGGGDLQQPAFRVLFTAFCSADQLVHAYSYSSATNSWSAPFKCPHTFGLIMCGPLAGVVTGEIVHWLYRDSTNFYTLDVCAEATHVSLTKIPIQVGRGLAPHAQQPPFPCIVGDGKLSFVNQLNSGGLELWTKRDQGDDHNRECVGEWMRSELMTEEEAMGVQILCFAESRGALVVKRRRNRHGLFTLDLDNKKMEPVRRGEGSRFCREYDHCTGCTRNNRVLYEMDWSSYLLLLSTTSLGSATR